MMFEEARIATENGLEKMLGFEFSETGEKGFPIPEKLRDYHLDSEIIYLDPLFDR